MVITYHIKLSRTGANRHSGVLPWHRGVMVITTVQLHSIKLELRFCAGSNPDRDVSEILDGKDF